MENNHNNILKDRLSEAWNVPPMPKGGKERFLQKLDKIQKPRSNMAKRVVFAMAAAASIIGAVFFLKTPNAPDESPRIDVTIAEVKGYYKSQMWTEVEYIEQLTREMEPEIRNELMAEAQKVMLSPDSVVKFLTKEQMPNDQKIACITYVYMSHLRSLQHMHTLLDSRKAQLSD